MPPVRPDPLDTLRRVLAPDVVDALYQLVDAAVEERLADTRHQPGNGLPELLTVEQAAGLASCTAAAMRMRLHRGRYETRHHGRRVYVVRDSVLREDAASSLAAWGPIR